jgi:hypothetical protein
VGLSFSYDAFDIKKIIKNKIINLNFIGHGKTTYSRRVGP